MQWNTTFYRVTVIDDLFHYKQSPKSSLKSEPCQNILSPVKGESGSGFQHNSCSFWPQVIPLSTLHKYIYLAQTYPAREQCLLSGDRNYTENWASFTRKFKPGACTSINECGQKLKLGAFIWANPKNQNTGMSFFLRTPPLGPGQLFLQCKHLYITFIFECDVLLHYILLIEILINVFLKGAV